MSPDGKECNEWTEWVNEVSAGGRDKDRTDRMAYEVESECSGSNYR